MPVEIARLTYFTNNDVSEEFGIGRQTLWRWRKKGRNYTKRPLQDRSGSVHRGTPYAEPHEDAPSDEPSRNLLIRFARCSGFVHRDVR
jgi:transposase-like protein